MASRLKWGTIWSAVIAFLLSLRATPVQAFGLLLFGALLNQYQQTALPYKEDPLTGNQPLLTEYDFIIVGAGSSGTLLANRLTENPNWKVLLIEAGEEDAVITEIPIIVDYFQQTDYNWGYSMERQPNVCLGNVEQRCKWPRGKVMGGTSTINYMIYTRGNQRDYDEWEAMGNTGWGYKSVLPYFLKSERCSIPEYNNSRYHRRDGLLSVERVPGQTPLRNIFIDAGKEMGYKIIDYNNPKTHIGFSTLQANMHRGRRTNGVTAFLRPIRNRPNLHILAEARATRVLFDQSTMRATSVELVRRRRWKVIRARKEVILSAGAINSPHILMHSGIGPADHLTDKGVRVLKDLKVGYNLNEHVSTSGLTFLVNQSISLNYDNVHAGKTYADFFKGTGYATIPGGVEGLAYIRTKYNTDPTGRRPDMEFIFSGGAVSSDGGTTIRKGMGISDETYEAMWGDIPTRHAWTVWPMILNPRSRGRIMLKDNNPFHWPLMYGNYFQDEIDLKVIVEGIKAVIRMSQTKAFQQVGSTLHRASPPGCANIEFGTDPYWECLVRQVTTTLHHQSGTCKMGPASDPDAVVDPQLRVYGTTGLRVVDASIIPKLPAAHTNAVAYMIAEKAADFIKNSYKNEAVPPSFTLPTPTATPPGPTQYPNQPPAGYPGSYPTPPPQTSPPSGYPGPQPNPSYPTQSQGSGDKPSIPLPPPSPPSGYPAPPQGSGEPSPPAAEPQPSPGYPTTAQGSGKPSIPLPEPQPPTPPQGPPPQYPQQPTPPPTSPYPQQPMYPQQPPQPPQYPQYPQQPTQQPQYPQQPTYPPQPSYPQSQPQQPTWPQQPQPENGQNPCPYPLVPVKHPSIPLPDSPKYLCQDPNTVPTAQYPQTVFRTTPYYENEVRSFAW